MRLKARVACCLFLFTVLVVLPTITIAQSDQEIIQRIAELEQWILDNPGVFDWNVHNELRHLYSIKNPPDLRKSMEHSNVILQYSVMDEYILNILSGWQIGNDSSAARTNLLMNAQTFPDLRFIAAASFLKIGDLYTEEGNLAEARSFYLRVAGDTSPDMEQYRILAQDRLQTSPGQPPEITLLGADPLQHTAGCPFVGAGATATDAEDGDLTDSIIITGTENLNNPGLYTITYSVTDSSRQSDSKSKQVIVFGVIGTPSCFVGIPAGKAPYLVVLVHGCCTDANDIKNDWESLGRSIAEEIQISTPEQWEIVVWDWSDYTPKEDLDKFGKAYNNAKDQGDILGRKIAEHPYMYAHLIGHSAGARLIWMAGRRLAIEKVSNDTPEEWPFIHMTFLDAYTPNYGWGNPGSDDYGNLYEYPKYYSEHYVDKGLSLTNACLSSAFNFNITGWPSDNPDVEKRDLGHQWPRYWYQNSVTTQGFRSGYPLSLEGSGKNINELVNELANYPAGQQCPLFDKNTDCKLEQDDCWLDF